jgi:predicted porin
LLAVASSAQAGITIPAGDWTVDLGGNVNAFYSHTKVDGATAQNTIGTGLLPAAIGIGAKSRQNDLDIAVQFSFFTGASAGGAGTAKSLESNTLNIRQAFLTVGDASWGTIKAGRDLGVYGSDAILSDMTLLGVGGNLAPGGSSTLGRIGQGYIYADWYGQFAYTTPSWNGFQVTGAVLEPVNAAGQPSNDMMYQGKATYDFAVSDVTGRVWVSGTTQKNAGYTSEGWDLGAKAAYQGATLVGYYYDGTGLSSVNRQVGTVQVGTVGVAAPSSSFGRNVLMGATNGSLSNVGVKSDDSGGYVQATFAIPGVGTKLGASWGESNSTYAGNKATVETWIVGAYHPLTKSLNLVAEYANADNKYTGMADTTVKTTSLGAILFF